MTVVMIQGVVDTKTVLTHLSLILKEFGFRVWLTCLWVILSGKHTTFLEIITR